MGTARVGWSSGAVIVGLLALCAIALAPACGGSNDGTTRGSGGQIGTGGNTGGQGAQGGGAGLGSLLTHRRSPPLPPSPVTWAVSSPTGQSHTDSAGSLVRAGAACDSHLDLTGRSQRTRLTSVKQEHISAHMPF